ncbi:MAG: formylmethanofuran--tetrahydromethanopterin N-formyltransferase [Pirellulaceae bacterium]
MNQPPASVVDPRIEDTYAEAFGMKYTRLIVTAVNDYWLEAASAAFCGYGTSVIGCDAETGVERHLAETETPDGRPGLAILAFGFSADALAQAVANRAGQCLMTCPTTAVFNGLDSDDIIPLGQHLRFFGDGFQKSKLLGHRRFWRIPVMDGEFVVEENLGVTSGIGGGNFILQAADLETALRSAEAAVAGIGALSGCITPFPGGVARSGSKVGSQYLNQVASTAEAFCPTLRGRVPSKLHEQTAAALEIVIDAIDESSVRHAMQVGIRSALSADPGGQLLRVAAGNYGGKLGKYLIPLHEVLADSSKKHTAD